MNRHVVSMALTLLLPGGGPVTGQTAARVDFRTEGLGVSVAIGDLPYRAHPHASTAEGWIAGEGWAAADWGRVRIWAVGARPVWRRDVLRKQDLRYLLGRETVRRIEWHARDMGLAGPLEGRWFRAGRYTTLLEVTARGVPVAELYDYGNDGYIDRVFLTVPHAGAWHIGVRPAPVVVRPPRPVVVSTVRAQDRRVAGTYKENPGKRGRGKGRKNR
jgi:hypothetical protein